MKIGLAGNPNSGKTTLFNAITGKTEYVGNWAGVTVDKKEANLKREYNKNKITIVDLPGAYSIAPFTNEEAIARDFVLGEKPDAIINIIDASNLERSLFFTTQLLELDIPVVIALNKIDILRKHGESIDLEGLSKDLHCEVVSVVANEGEGLKELLSRSIDSADKKTQASPDFSGKGTEGEDQARQAFVKEIITGTFITKRKANEITFSDKVDRIVASPYLGLPIFALIMWGVYSFSINGLGGFLSGYVNDTLFGVVVPDFLNGFFETIGVNTLLQSLIIDGAIGGVGAVIGFLPLIMVLFFCLALLEDSGYMSRVAVVMDRYFKRIGLSGKSVIPMIVGTGCSIPGVMAARTIEDDNERIVTIMLTPFVPCSAKLPIIALMAVVFFPGQSWVFPSMYLIAGVLIIIGGLLLKKILKFESTSTFILELPEYKIPSLKHAFRQMIKQAKSFIIKASTIILVMNTVVWFMQSYSWNFQLATDQNTSILAIVGGIIAPLLIPIGFAGWQMAAAILTGFVAKENVVATFAIILISSDAAIHSMSGPLTELFTPVTAFAFLVFNLFTPPCFAAIGAMNAELGSKKWIVRAILFQIGVGYTLAMLITQIGTPLIYGHLATGFIPAVVVALFVAGILYYLIKKGERIS
ncbi:MAG: ferrous iron transport protein B [Peptostreptococcaceae bacterium]|nr:ferrous iron transport protein B [Peptostreptococcaceae bacterium]